MLRVLSLCVGARARRVAVTEGEALVAKGPNRPGEYGASAVGGLTPGSEGDDRCRCPSALWSRRGRR